MRQKLINLGVIVSSLFAFMEWGGGNSMFLFEAEMELISNALIDPLSVIHPMTLLPLAGQIMLVITMFQKKPNKKMTIIGILCLTLLIGFLFFIGVIGFNFSILISTVPFLCLSFFAIRENRTRLVDGID